VLLAFGSYSGTGLGKKERHLDQASKEPFKKFLGALLAEKRSVPTLVRVNHRLQN
jgi:hypothetical protein